MATIKAYTDTNQSKKLAEFLPIESADMWWCYFYDIISDTSEYGEEPILHKPSCEPELAIPCWSLSALLDIFPCGKELPLVNLTRGGWIPSFTRRWFATWEDENKNIFYSGDGITSVDAVVELILKLHEQKVL